MQHTKAEILPFYLSCLFRNIQTGLLAKHLKGGGANIIGGVIQIIVTTTYYCLSARGKRGEGVGGRDWGRGTGD